MQAVCDEHQDSWNSGGEQGLEVLIVGIEVVPDEVGVVFLDGIDAEFVGGVASAHAPRKVLFANFQRGFPNGQAYLAAAAAQVVGFELAHVLDGVLETVDGDPLGFVEHDADTGYHDDDTQSCGNVGVAYKQKIYEPDDSQQAEGENARFGLQEENPDHQNAHYHIKHDFDEQWEVLIGLVNKIQEKIERECGIQRHVGGMSDKGEMLVVQVYLVAGLDVFVESNRKKNADVDESGYGKDHEGQVYPVVG